VTAYVVRRLMFGVLIVWGVYTITFLAVNLAPGDPFTGKESAKVTEADLDRLRAQWGYDLSVPRRYFLHLRRMFWADDDVLLAEGGGIAFEIVAGSGTNEVSAAVQAPPDEVVLVPTRESAQDDGAEPVTLRRLPDGSYETRPLPRGQYRFGPRLRRLAAYAADNELVAGGVVIRYDGTKGEVSATVALRTPPAEIRLVPAASGEPVVLPLGEGGRSARRPIGPGRWAYEGAADLLVPEKVLGRARLRFDLGTSIQHGTPVFDYLRPKLWATLKLGFWALFVDFCLGITLGIVSAVRRDTLLDHATMVGAFFLYSMPGFWLALMLQLVFAVKLGWLPIHGLGDGSLLDGLRHYAMPVFVLGVTAAAGTARYQRSAVLEILREDYVRTARAKGLDEWTVIRKHMLRNSLLPVITLVGLSMPILVSGAVITEQIFSWPGMGRAAIEAIQSRDVFVVTAVTLAATVMVVIGSLAADICYALADPRVRLQ
jgi:peptide/nickel transport system permease protein